MSPEYLRYGLYRLSYPLIFPFLSLIHFLIKFRQSKGIRKE